jgi:hypothetical protein
MSASRDTSGWPTIERLQAGRIPVGPVLPVVLARGAVRPGTALFQQEIGITKNPGRLSFAWPGTERRSHFHGCIGRTVSNRGVFQVHWLH